MKGELGDRLGIGHRVLFAAYHTSRKEWEILDIIPRKEYDRVSSEYGCIETRPSGIEITTLTWVVRNRVEEYLRILTD